MARVGVAPITASVRPMPTTIMNIERCPSNIISSPTVLSYSNRRSSSSFWRSCCCHSSTQMNSCIHVDFMRRASGILKLTEAVRSLDFGFPFIMIYVVYIMLGNYFCRFWEFCANFYCWSMELHMPIDLERATLNF